MNLLFTTNANYLIHVFEVLRSILDYNNDELNVYILSSDIENKDVDKYCSYLKRKVNFNIIKMDDESLSNAPVVKRYPSVIYYRLFAASYLPKKLDKILYLDPDLIVKGNLSNLYNLDLNGYLFAGASHIQKFLLRFNQIKNGADKKNLYVNTGVLLMNLNMMRVIIKPDEVIKYIDENKYALTLPDQDIINAMYGDKILLIDRYIYNIADRDIVSYNLTHVEKIDEEWVDKNVVIIHYYGKNKPWKNSYRGILLKYYKKYQINQ